MKSLMCGCMGCGAHVPGGVAKKHDIQNKHHATTHKSTPFQHSIVFFNGVKKRATDYDGGGLLRPSGIPGVFLSIELLPKTTGWT